ncbi:MAG: hypothetical protein RLY20_1168, partial [Verrucomicrobiota bacterium]
MIPLASASPELLGLVTFELHNRQRTILRAGITRGSVLR